MKTTNYFLACLIALLSFSYQSNSQTAADSANVTFQVDMSNVTSSFSIPEVNGTFNNWCGNCWAMSDANNDNIWEITGKVLKNTNFEFKFAADNWNIQENLFSGDPCVVSNFGFTNRTLNVSSDTVLPVVCWESCGPCGSGTSAYNVTFQLDMNGVSGFTTPEVNGTFNNWCGSCWQMSDNDGDNIWDFTTLFAPGTYEFKFSADNWNVQEVLDSSLSCVNVVPDSSLASGFAINRFFDVVASDLVLDAVPWGGCSVALVDGCTDATANNYNSSANNDDGSCTYDMTFTVDMNCAGFTAGYVSVTGPSDGWSCGSYVLDDLNNDGVWEGTFSLPSGNFEYIYCADGWANSEAADLLAYGTASGDWSCTPVTDYWSFANRQVSVGAYSTNDTWGSCSSCQITVLGCTDSSALNYDSNANTDDGSCQFISPSTSLISDCDDFVSGPNAWPYVLVATTLADGAASQSAQTFTMNVTSLPVAGANVRVYKTVANGNDFFETPVALTLGSNSITVPAVTFDRAVKFQFSSGDVEFDVLSLNGDDSDCVGTPPPPPSTSLISDCDDFVSGPNAWPYVLVATTLADGAASQSAQTFTMNVTSLPAGGANVRVYKTVANGNDFFGTPVALTLGSNSITVSAVTFDRVVKFQFSSGDVEFDALSLNGDDSDCVGTTTIVSGCTDPAADNYDATASVDDGSCTYSVYGCTDNTQFNYDPLATIDDGSCIPYTYGCTDPVASNYNSSVNTDDGSCIYLGCTDPAADNYDATATVDDGSCTYSSVCSEGPITGLFIDGIIDDRVNANFDNMNTYDANGNQVCRVDQIRIQYRPVGTSAWSAKNIASPVGYDPNTGICNSTQATMKPIRNLTLATTYEWRVKVWYCSGGNGGWGDGTPFTTADECPNVANLTAYGANPTKATFDWDASNGVYEFVRIKLRVDSISNPSGSDWTLAGGFGVPYGTNTKNKNGLVPGETYRGQARTWCDPNGGAYNSLSWTPLVTWTQPTNRLEGGTSINNLDVYPNPSRDVFNVAFTSEDVQDLEVRVINVVGEVVYTENLQQFVGEYTKSIDLATYTKGVYFLEITTNNGVVNKKLILQ